MTSLFVQITIFNISLVIHGTIAENMDHTEVIKVYFLLEYANVEP